MTELQNINPHGNEMVTLAEFVQIDHDKKIIHLYDKMEKTAYNCTALFKATVTIKNNGVLTLTAEGVIWQEEFRRYKWHEWDYYIDANKPQDIKGPFGKWKTFSRDDWDVVNISKKEIGALWWKKTVEVLHDFAYKLETQPVDISYHGWELRKHK